MPEQLAGLARMSDGDLFFGLAGVHAGAVVAIANRWSRSAAHTWPATVSGLPLASTSTQRSGSSAAIGRPRAAPRRRPLQPDLDGNVEDDGQVRLEIANGDPLHGVEHAGRDIA